MYKLRARFESRLDDERDEVNNPARALLFFLFLFQNVTHPRYETTCNVADMR